MNKEIDQARKTLELPSSATLKEVKKAYRALSKKWHPDRGEKGKEKLCHEKMKAVNKAYRLISQYIESYSYPFSKEKALEETPQERWKAQFGGDPHWGKG